MAESNYYLTWQISADPNLRVRLEASVATETDRNNIDLGMEPFEFVNEYKWDYAVTPGWVEAVASAIANNNVDWGRDPTVITDGMILSRTQELLNEESSPGNDV